MESITLHIASNRDVHIVIKHCVGVAVSFEQPLRVRDPEIFEVE